MSLAPGSQIGAYRVVGPLGAGGMGVVFRARDTALDREVALKTLPEAFASQPERVALFEREAKVLASLNHPNIAAIHGLEASGSTRVLVLELVPGETLAERLERGPLPIEEAIDAARQIADALESAHEHNVVHRDLKPGNIKLTPDGKVKVLDFGLAKALRGETLSGAPWSAPSQSPTWATPTDFGGIVGTAAYMSPEQARGRAVDKRADIWAFGVVFYEMLTAKHAFQRADTTETLAAVLRDEVDWSALPPATPEIVRRLLRRCLERDPRNRLRDIGDARLELEEAGSPAAAAAAGSAGPARRPRALALLALLGAAAAGAALAAGAVTFTLARLRPAPTRPQLRFEVNAPAGLRINDLELSPDGATMAFTGIDAGARRSQVYLRALDQIEARPLDGTEGGRMPFFSPDGEWLGFASGAPETGDAELRRVAIGGGAASTICRGDFRGASWQPDGTIVLGSTRGLHAVAATGGAARPLTTPAEGESHRKPVPVPGTRRVLFQVWTGSEPDARIEVVDLDSGERSRVIDGASPALSPTGHLLFIRGDALWAVRLEPKNARAAEEPVRLVERVGKNFRAEAVYAFSGANLLYKAHDDAPALLAAWVDRSGKRTPVPLPHRELVYPRISPDGKRLGYGASGLENEDVWLFDLERSMPIRFTFHPAQELDLAWTPDGRQIVFHSHRDGPGNLYRQAANGTGAIERLTTVPEEQMPNDISPDGRWLVITAEAAETGFDLYLLALDRRGEAVPLLRTPANEASADFSPDGRFIAYASDESGRSEIYVRPFPNLDSDRWQVTSGGAQAPLFSPDGRELFFSADGGIKRVAIETAPFFRAGTVEAVLVGPFVRGGTDERQYDVAPDGRRFLVLEEVAGEAGGASEHLVVALNWADQLPR